MNETYFRSYEGRKPYLFISYAHLDSERVVPLLSLLKYAPAGEHAANASKTPEGKRASARCYRIWYDEGIDAGSEWPENIERHMQNAAYTIVFWSKASAASKNCYREMVNALGGGKPVLFVLLDDTPLPAAHSAGHPAIPAADASVADMLARIVKSGHLDENLIGEDYPTPPKPPWLLLSALTILFLAIVGGAVYLTRTPVQETTATGESLPALTPTATPAATPVAKKDLASFQNPVVAEYVYETLSRYDLMPSTIKDDVLRRAVYEKLQLPPDAEPPDAAALSAIRELHICGDKIASGREAVSMVDGKFYVDGEAVRRGKICFTGPQETEQNDYRAIACMSGLTSLTLSFQTASGETGMESFATLPALRYLDLSGNTGISGSTGFSFLWYNSALTELNIAHTDVTELVALNSVPNLEKVYVSRDMIKGFMHAMDKRLQFDVIVID